MRYRYLLALLLMALPRAAMAQTFVTATSGISFPASPDHAVGVDRYDMNVVAANSLGAIAFTKSLGKPAPDAAGVITVKPIAEFGTVTVNTSFVVIIDAMGTTGDKVASVPSDPFVRLGPPRPPGKPTVVK